MTPAERSRRVFAVLLFLVLISGLAAVYAKHQSRKLFAELETLVSQRDRLTMDWGRLQIEESTQANYARVEAIAREQLTLRTATVDDIRWVSQ